VFNRSTSHSRIGLVSAAVVALLVLSAGSVAADTTPGGDGTFTQNGTSAEAYSGGCTPNGNDTTTCWDAGLSVFVGKMSDSVSGVSHGSQLCANTSSYTFDDLTGDVVGVPTYEFGCKVDLPSGTLAVGRNLTSLALRATTISIEQYTCDDEGNCEEGSSRNVTVAGTWTGVGPTSSSKSRSSGDDGTCRYADSGKGSSREASFVGSLGGLSIGTDGYASLSNGKFSYRSRCSEI
jgi:hypothetical protein